MPGYWLQCDSCQTEESFQDVCGMSSAVRYIREVMLPSNWDQSKLTLDCPKCGKHELRIAYDFPRADRVRLSVLHIVGLVFDDPYYLPMMWEARATHDPEPWIDFKYINGNNPWGLNKPAVFSRSQLKKLFTIYEERCGGVPFP